MLNIEFRSSGGIGAAAVPEHRHAGRDLRGTVQGGGNVCHRTLGRNVQGSRVIPQSLLDQKLDSFTVGSVLRGGERGSTTMKNGNIVDVCGVQQAAYLLVTAFHAVGRQTPLGGFDLEMGGTDTTHIKLRSEQMVQDGKVIIALVFCIGVNDDPHPAGLRRCKSQPRKKFRAFHVVLPQFSFTRASFSAASFSSSNILLL